VRNIELAADAIHGKTLAPSATFSFNEAVGERTAAFGFEKSVVLRDGMLAEGMGGGACQVASTLHAAALLAGLEIVERAPHSRPSAYIRMGLDATVAKTIDLKIKNPTTSPWVIRARAVKGELSVWFESTSGVRSLDEVVVTSEIKERTAFTRVTKRDHRITDDRTHVTAFGIPGYRVRRERELHFADGTVRRDVRFDVYPPVSEVVLIGTAPQEVSELEADGGEPTSLRARTIDPGVLRPALVQLRPSERVVLRATPALK
jgi:vancomycin resistance protein YoaR